MVRAVFTACRPFCDKLVDSVRGRELRKKAKGPHRVVKGREGVAKGEEPSLGVGMERMDPNTRQLEVVTAVGLP